MPRIGFGNRFQVSGFKFQVSGPAIAAADPNGVQPGCPALFAGALGMKFHKTKWAIGNRQSAMEGLETC
jgi:hypothetical protein